MLTYHVSKENIKEVKIISHAYHVVIHDIQLLIKQINAYRITGVLDNPYKTGRYTLWEVDFNAAYL
jgi:hypothetical protein